MIKFTPELLKQIIEEQVENILPNVGSKFNLEPKIYTAALDKTLRCMQDVIQFSGDFDYLVTGQQATYIYYLSRLAFEGGCKTEATKLFVLNKSLNGIDLYYEVLMPSVFLIGHTVGMVYAKATYGEYCVFHQGCTVGRNGNFKPQIGNGTIMYPGSMIIGNSVVGDNVVLSAGVKVINKSVPNNCIVYESNDGLIYKELDELYCKKYFKISDLNNIFR